jgi:hypothetical protein
MQNFPKNLLWFPILTLTFLLSACPRQSKPEGAMTTAPVKVSEQKGQETQPGGDYSLGVPECDQFFPKFEKCILEKIPMENRAEWRAKYEKVVEKIHLLFERDQQAVPEACRQEARVARSETATLGCLW